MILRAAFLSLAGTGAAMATLIAMPEAPAKGAEAPLAYVELPLAGIARLEEGRPAGVDFLRVGASLRAAGGERRGEESVVQAFVADALNHAALASPRQRGAPPDVAHLKAAVSVRLRRAGAPFALDRLVLLQLEHRSQERLRQMASAERPAANDE